MHLWEFLHGYFYHIVLLLLFSLLNLSNGLVRLLGRRTNPSLILAASFLVIILIGAGLLMLPRCGEKKGKDKFEERIEKAKESVEDVVDDAKDQIEDKADEVGETLDKAKSKIEKAKKKLDKANRD